MSAIRYQITTINLIITQHAVIPLDYSAITLQQWVLPISISTNSKTTSANYSHYLIYLVNQYSQFAIQFCHFANHFVHLVTPWFTIPSVNIDSLTLMPKIINSN